MTRLFVDEGKRRGYVMVAATVDDDDVNSLRGAVRRLQPPGAERIHFVHESDGRRRSLLKEFARLGIRTVVFDAGRLDDRAARVWCLERIVELAARANTSRIVIETDESIVQADNRTLYRAVAGLGSREQIRYEHQRAASEPLLWVPDAVAWAHGRGGLYRPLVEPLIERVVRYTD